MKKLIVLSLITLVLFACSSEKEGNMIVQGKITGLKKGTLYLQKMKDTLLVSVDSITLLGDDTFKLTDNIEYPEMYYLTFKGNATNNYILFFAEKGTITINDKISKFGLKPEITGSKNQEILDKFYKMARQFNDKKLDLFLESFEAKKAKDTDKIAKTDASIERLIRRRYLYTTNFAVTNAGYPVAPYIALTELTDANITLLDTINNSLSAEVKKSKYGKRLADFIADIKKNEK